MCVSVVGVCLDTCASSPTQDALDSAKALTELSDQLLPAITEASEEVAAQGPSASTPTAARVGPPHPVPASVGISPPLHWLRLSARCLPAAPRRHAPAQQPGGAIQSSGSSPPRAADDWRWLWWTSAVTDDFLPCVHKLYLC